MIGTGEYKGVLDFTLDFKEKREFRILQIADIQIIDASQQRYVGRLREESEKFWATENMDQRAFRFMREAVERAKPDLIVFSGDNVYGEFDDNGTVVQKFIKETDSYGIPWTFVFGNHDNETCKGIVWTCAQYEKAKNCLFSRGDITRLEGNGNFNIGIFRDGKLSAVVWLMDSHGQTDADIGQNLYASAGIYDGQKAWFSERNEKIAKLCGGRMPTGVGFCHHPFLALGKALQEKYGFTSIRHELNDKNGNPKPFEPLIIPENSNGDFGAVRKDVGGFIDRDFTFHSLLKKYGCKGWFFGHDHEVNASSEYDGLRYTFGLKASQYDSYYPTDVGGTLIVVSGEDIAVRHLHTELEP